MTSIVIETLERCDLCDTLLRWMFGNANISPPKEFRFTAHTPEFCRTLTKQRIEMLTDMIRGNALEMEHMRRANGGLWSRLVAAERRIEEADAGVRCPCCEQFFPAGEFASSSWCSSCRAMAGAPR